MSDRLRAGGEVSMSDLVGSLSGELDQETKNSEERKLFLTL